FSRSVVAGDLAGAQANRGSGQGNGPRGFFSVYSWDLSMTRGVVLSMPRLWWAGQFAAALFGASAIVATEGTAAPESVRHALSFGERLAAKRAIERVYWRHRLWPSQNPGPRPPFSALMPDESIRRKVEDSLRQSNALEKVWRRPIREDQLRAELKRMARDTRDPALLEELFDALGRDAHLIQETLARQTLGERLIRNLYATDSRFSSGEVPGTIETGHRPSGQSFDDWWKSERQALP